MAALSISRAWEETRQILVREGRLMASVALALVALPSAVMALISPEGASAPSSPAVLDGVVLLASLATLAGQLALIRLALGPSVTVGGAIAHGLRRMPIYLLSAVMIVLGLGVIALGFGLLLAVFGVPLQAETLPATPGVVAVVLLFVAVVLFAAVRMLMSGPVASAETVGPVAILRRSWALTANHSWRLLGFLAMFFIGAIVVLMAVGTASGIIARLLLGPIESMSAAALLVALVGGLANAAITALFAVMLARIYAQLAGRAAETSVPSSGT